MVWKTNICTHTHTQNVGKLTTPNDLFINIALVLLILGKHGGVVQTRCLAILGKTGCECFNVKKTDWLNLTTLSSFLKLLN